MNMDKKFKWFIGSMIIAAVTLFTILVMSSNSYSHDYRHSDHHYINQGHHGNFDGDYCPRYTSDEYRDLIEKQKKEREAFLKKQETKKVEVK